MAQKILLVHLEWWHFYERLASFFFLDFYLVCVHLTSSLLVNGLQKSGMQGPSTPIDLFFVLVKKGKRTSFSLLCSYNAQMINASFS